MVHTPLILVADGEPTIRRLVRLTLERAGYPVATVACGEAALAWPAERWPDLVILDLALPDIDGWTVLHRLYHDARPEGRVPVVVLTAHATDAERVQALRDGADDCLTMPFNPDELVARIGAILRRTAGTAPAGAGVLRYPGLEIDLDGRLVTASGGEVRLTRTEWAVLDALAGHAGRLVYHDELMTRIWGLEFRNDTHYLRTWISRMRTKLQRDPATPSLITTFSGLGYRFEVPAGDETAGDVPDRQPVPIRTGTGAA